ncbi:Arm DNA-binding domain-containing protein [uncultured Alistipes sp.]|uniref:Arm DNA-binding domain-containing protein n=1 Tax=uncultured Alistipes sp. TaxID=538949 RepID=UPI002588A95F|nr:Arm DNA-binding domain-containing protein [uncultured Alistipes sp.]
MKIKAIYRHEIVYKNGKSPLAIRFTHQRTHKTVSLGISVEPHYWDKETETIAANCPERATLQKHIGKLSQEDSKVGSAGYSREFRYVVRCKTNQSP